ncbi:MAG: DUF2849 domain-containing protein [Myxococcota bacterium]
MPQIVIASRLSDGRTVFLARNGRWAEFIQEGALAQTTDESAEILRTAQEAERRQEIVEPYLIEVIVDFGAVRPVETREAIRAAGPTIRRDLGKQAEA